MAVVIDSRGLGLTTVARGPSRPMIQPPRRGAGAGGTSGVTAPSPQTSPGLRGILGGLLPIIGGTVGGPIGAAVGGVVAEGLLGPALPGGGQVPARKCPPPTIYDPKRDICITPGSPGEISIPDVTDVSPDVSMGVFGMLSTSPIIVGEIRGSPIRRCPPGLVLAKDDRCYSKRDLPRSLRKWPPHKCRSRVDRQLADIKRAGAAAKSLKRAFKGTGLSLR